MLKMKLTKKKKYDINQCSLYKCRNKRKLAELLRLSYSKFNELDKLIEYHSFTKEKRDGDKRIITAPNNDLKKIQKRILRLFTYVERPEWLISGERGKSYIDNGKSHINSDYFLTIDIRKFYDNCKREYIYRFFQDTLSTSSDVAAKLTDIVTFEKKVPTGCPTSQIIAYYAYQEMFENINKIAQKHGCIFTLYVDDMTFSSKLAFNHNQLSNDIDIELRRYGHKPKYSKVKYFPKKSHKLVTGVVVSKNHKLVVANNLRKKIYDGAMLLLCPNKEEKPPVQKDLQSLKGRILAAKSVNSRIFPEINRLVENTIIESELQENTYNRSINNK